MHEQKIIEMEKEIQRKFSNKIAKNPGNIDYDMDDEKDTHKFEHSEEILNTNKKRFLEFNKLNMTMINESDEKVLNESCEFSETSIQENPHNFFRNTNEKDNKDNKSIGRLPFERASNASLTKKDLCSNNEELLASINNTCVEFESLDHTPKKKITDRDLALSVIFLNSK